MDEPGSDVNQEETSRRISYHQNALFTGSQQQSSQEDAFPEGYVQRHRLSYPVQPVKQQNEGQFGRQEYLLDFLQNVIEEQRFSDQQISTEQSDDTSSPAYSGRYFYPFIQQHYQNYLGLQSRAQTPAQTPKNKVMEVEMSGMNQKPARADTYVFCGEHHEDLDPTLENRAKVFDMFSSMRRSSVLTMNINQKTFDPYKIPPDWQMAEEHQQSVRVAKPCQMHPGSPISVDEMSGRPIHNTRLSLFCKPEDLSFLGPCYPMYFQFITFTWTILVVFIIISGLFSLVANYNGTFCNEDPSMLIANSDTSSCPGIFETKISLANSINSTSVIYVWQLLNFASFCVCVIVFQFFRYRQRKFAAECDERELTASDFTLEAKNLPIGLDIDLRKELKEFITNYALPFQKVEVCKVVLAYDVSEKLKILEELGKLHVQAAQIGRHIEKGLPPKGDLSLVKSKIVTLKDKLHLLNHEYESGKSNKFLGRAFVTINTQSEVEEIVEYWKRGKLRRIMERFKGVSGRVFHLKPMVIEDTDEPSDVFWENLGVWYWTKVQKRIISLFIMGVVLAICASIVLGISLWKISLTTGSNKSSNGYLYLNLLSSLSSLVIVVINMVLAQVSRRLTIYEQYSTWTNFYIAAASKQAWAMFFNTALVTFIIYTVIGNYWGIGGMIKVITQVFIINAFYGPIYNLVNPFYQLKKFLRNRAKSKGDRSLLTQKQANLLFQDMVTDFSWLYAAVMKNMFSAAFYAPIVPSALFWALIGNILMYWVDKYNITQRGSVARCLGPKLAREMTELLEYFLVIYAIGNLVFNIRFVRDSGIPELQDTSVGLPIAALVLAVLHALAPMGWVNKKLFGKVNGRATTETYESLRLYLDEDYDRANPATKEKALDDFSKEIQINGDPRKYYNRFLKRYHISNSSN